MNQNYKKYALWVMVGIVLLLSAMVLTPFASAIFVALVLTVLTYPVYQRFRKKMSDSMAALATVLSTIFVVAIPLGLIGLMLFLQFQSVAKDFERAPDGSAQALTVENVAIKLDSWIQPPLKQAGVDFSVAEYVEENRETLTKQVTAPVTKAAVSTLVAAVSFVVSFLTMFFMLRDGHKLRDPAISLIPLPEDRAARIIDRVELAINSVFRGILVVAVLQGTIATVTYAVLGIEGWFLWGAATTILCAIPLLGAPVVYVPLSLALFGAGKIWQGIVLLVVGFGIVSNVDNILRPLYIGERTGLHYISIFFALLGGVLAFGPVGIMAGPVLLVIALELIDYLKSTGIVGAPKSDDPGDSIEVDPAALHPSSD